MLSNQTKSILLLNSICVLCYEQTSGNVVARRPPKFSFVVDGLLAGQGRPTSSGHLQYLCDLGIKYIVTLTLNKPRALNEIPGIQAF